MWKKLSKFARLKRKWKLLLIEALLSLAWARLLKSLPFSRVAPTLGNRREESSPSHRPGDEHALYSVSKAVRWMARHTPWESKCMVMAIAGKRMLERRNIDSTLYFGTARDASGRWIAHAWLRSGPFVITGEEEMRKFTVVETFGGKPKGRPRPAPRRSG